MRDKPGTRPDGYHTCYSLAGLSAAQNHYFYDEAVRAGEGGLEQCAPLTAAFNWRAERPSKKEMDGFCYEESDLVEFVHPVFVVPMEVVERTRKLFEGVVGF